MITENSLTSMWLRYRLDTSLRVVAGPLLPRYVFFSGPHTQFLRVRNDRPQYRNFQP